MSDICPEHGIEEFFCRQDHESKDEPNYYYASFVAEDFPEHVKFKGPFTGHQLQQLEQVWVATPSGQRLEAVSAKAMQLGVEIESMSRVRAPEPNARIKFWDCPEDHPREPQRVRIVWDGDLATCLDCGRTNRD